MTKINLIKDHVKSRLSKSDLKSWIECYIENEGIKDEIDTNKIPDAIRYALNKKSGWPIGVILPPSEKSIQKFTDDDFTNEVFGTELYNSYDFAYYSNDGKIYLASSLHENGTIDLEFIIKRIIEVLFFIRQYNVFWILNNDVKIVIDFKFSGIQSFQNFLTPKNLIPPTERKNKLMEIQMKTSMNELFYNFRDISFKILCELFSPFGIIPDQELKLNKWIGEYINSTRS